MPLFKRGDLVVLNGAVAAVIAVEGDANVPEGHICLWYGGQAKGDAETVPVVWTVPLEYCTLAPAPDVRH